MRKPGCEAANVHKVVQRAHSSREYLAKARVYWTLSRRKEGATPSHPAEGGTGGRAAASDRGSAQHRGAPAITRHVFGVIVDLRCRPRKDAWGPLAAAHLLTGQFARGYEQPRALLLRCPTTRSGFPNAQTDSTAAGRGVKSGA